MGGHCIDLLEMFFGSVVQVSCFTGNTIHQYGTEDSATVLLRFANGAMATVDTFFCIQDVSSKNVLELYGSRGSILAQGTIGQGSAGVMTAYLPSADTGYEAQQARAEGASLVIAPEPRNMYLAEIEEFSQSLLDQRTSVLDAQLGLRSQRVLSACYASAQSGSAVAVE
jgi:predicted dehydrogenase